MTIDIKLFTNEKETSEGFPIAVMISNKRDRKRKNISFSFEKHFNKDNKMINKKHPDFDVLAPI